MEIDRETLLHVLEQVRPGVSKRETIIQASDFVFLGSRVVTYNDLVSVSYVLPGIEVEGAVPAEALYKMLQSLTSATIDLHADGTSLIVTGGGSKATFTLKSEIQLPFHEIGEADAWQTLDDPSRLIDALAFARQCCARSNTDQPALTCVRLDPERGLIEATDRLQASRHYTTLYDGDAALLPQRSVRSLVGYGVDAICPAPSSMHFRLDEGAGCFSCRVYAAPYPDLDALFQVEGATIDLSGVDSDALAGALKRAALVLDVEDTRDAEVSITLDGREMTVEAEGRAGSYRQVLHNDADAGEAITFLTNPQVFGEILAHTRTAVLGDNRLKFAGEHWEHVIALRRVDKEE